jgi:hypothetical protein
MQLLTPMGVLRIHKKAKDGVVPEPSEPIYGGYANHRGQISLFGETVVYRINFKLGTIQERPRLNPGAQARYDATGLGETFQYGNVSFRRLSSAEIVEICSSGSFRVTPKLAA